MDWFEALNSEITNCRRCPRLVEWRERIALEKRRSFENDLYWGRPVPYFGDPKGTRLIVGLAPAAHGANRTGRMFTGDRSGDWLYRALQKVGLANQVTSTSRNDGLELKGAVIAAVCHCAPPDNKPSPLEISNCSDYLARLLSQRPWRSILCLGSISWHQVHRTLGAKAPKFAHAIESQIDDITLIASYHPSQQNTFTGRLTEDMLDAAVKAWTLA